MFLNAPELYEFEGFRLDVGERILERKGKRLQVTDRAFDVLSVLVRNNGRLVTKEQLLEEVWPDAFVEENSINKNISLLRKALGNGRVDAKFIETVRGRGYRFTANVENIDSSAAKPEPSVVSNNPQPAPAKRFVEQEVGNVVALVDWRPKQDADPIRNISVAPVSAGSAIAETRSPRSAMMWIVTAVIVIGLAALAYVVWWNPTQPVSQPAGEVRTIAVLPFKPISGGSRDEAFEIGIADTLISKISASRQIIVRPLSAVRRYSSMDADELAAGRELEVDAVLGGSIHRSSDKVRINVTLLRVSDGMALWSRTFDESMTDIFSVQDAISQKVVSALNIKLSGDEELQLAKRYTDSPQAYEYYLRGRAHYFKITLPDLEKAAEYFQKAIETDPNYALAYAWLADTYRTLGVPAFKPATEVHPIAKQYALRALELDESLPDAHIVLAWIHLFYDWDWPASEREARRAIELAPNNSEAHRVYAHLLSVTGRHDEAIAEGQKARELAPLTLITASLEGQFLMYAGRLDEAEDRLKKTLEIDPEFWVALNTLAKVYWIQGRYDAAIETMRRARTNSGGSNESTGYLGYMLAKTGNRSEAQAILAELESKQTSGAVPMGYVAGIKWSLGEKDAALDALEKAVAQRESGMAFMKLDHRWDGLRDDPRFQAIMRKVNLQ